MENLKISKIKAAGKSITVIAYLSLVSIVLSLIMYFHVSNLNTKDYWKTLENHGDDEFTQEFIPGADAADFKVIYTSYAVVFGIILLIQLINLFRAGFALKNCDLESTIYGYEGELKDGKKHGQGTQIYEGGAKYEGEWMNDMKHGQGTFTYTNGTIKKGLWENNIFVGE